MCTTFFFPDFWEIMHSPRRIILFFQTVKSQNQAAAIHKMNGGVIVICICTQKFNFKSNAN